MTPIELAATWEAEAERLRAWGQDSPARLLERCAVELREARESEERVVGYTEAALLSGYSVAQLRRLVRAGALRDRATTGPTMLAVSDLPRKPLRRWQSRPQAA